MIIHEEGEAGHDMPDLERPVQAVSKAVENLVKVRKGRMDYILKYTLYWSQHNLLMLN